MGEDALRSIAAFINQKDDFTIIAHTSPDGDALGASLGLYRALIRMGKRAQLVCDQTVPHAYVFLPGAEQVMLPDAARQTEYAIAVDCADRARMGAAAVLFDNAKETCVIDHHETNRGYGDHNAIDGNAAAAGELIAALLKLLDVEPDVAIATCLYTAIMTDTGNFAYSNTRPETLRIGAELLASGADNTEINRRIYRTVPFAKQKLLGRGLSNMLLLCEGKLCLTHLMQADFAETGATSADADGIVEHLRDVEGVEAAAFIKEQGEGVFKVSLRSQKAADMGKIAQRMGGGGHKHAAGYTTHGTLNEVISQATALCVGAIKEVWKEL